MPVRVFNLRGVPDDEAEDIRALLTEHNIDYYETAPGNWGISAPGIWLTETDQLEPAKSIIDTYQTERAQQQRELYEQLKREGKHRTFWTLLREEPLKIIAYIGIVLLILYFSTRPFVSLGS